MLGYLVTLRGLRAHLPELLLPAASSAFVPDSWCPAPHVGTGISHPVPIILRSYICVYTHRDTHVASG